MRYVFTIIAGISLLLFGVFVTPVIAEENRSDRFVLPTGVIICDELEELIEMLDAGKGVEMPAGCGYTQKPMYAERIPLGGYTTKGYDYDLIRLEFPMQTEGENEVTWWPQFTWWGEPHQTVTPTKMGVKAMIQAKVFY